MPIDHPLHRAVADEIARVLVGKHELLRDPACGGGELLSLFVGPLKARETRMCCVDLLVVSAGCVHAIVEIEESGFLPTKICGKVLQSALASHYIPESPAATAIPYGDEVVFVQVLDKSKCLKPGTRKDTQAGLIEHEIQGMLPMRGITDYRLLFASTDCGSGDLAFVGEVVATALA